MSASGTSRAETRRSALVALLADHVLAHGLSGANLRPLAKAVGTSDRMLLYYFRDKAELITAVLEAIAAKLGEALASRMAPTPLPVAQLRAHLASVLLDAALWPYLRVWLEIASLAAGGDATCREVGGRIGQGFLVWIAAQLASDDPSAEASRLMATLEGMVLLKALGMDDVVARVA